MGFMDKVKTSKIGDEAQRAIAEGRSVFLARINVGITDAGFSGAVTGAAEIIESIEAIGWRLDQMSYTQDKKGGPEGYYLFRRAAQMTYQQPAQQAYGQQNGHYGTPR